jgi:hypothetical protein
LALGVLKTFWFPTMSNVSSRLCWMGRCASIATSTVFSYSIHWATRSTFLSIRASLCCWVSPSTVGLS